MERDLGKCPATNRITIIDLKRQNTAARQFSHTFFRMEEFNRAESSAADDSFPASARISMDCMIYKTCYVLTSKEY